MGLSFRHITKYSSCRNYLRDKMGRLVKDKQEYIDTILWTATNKVKAVIKTPSDTLKNIFFDYDAFGNQIAKHVYNSQTAMLEKSTYYLLDAQSNQLSIYEHTVDTNESTAKYYLAERNIYGSARLGSSFDTINMFAPEILPSYGILGNRNYELTDHRNNIYTIISDIKYPISSDNSTIDSYEVGIAQITDYSPFGVELDGRTIQNSKYRYSFQNQEHHDEIKGKGNYMNYKYRGYDPRIGRLDWTLDPLAPKYPYYSPYQFSGNRVIDMVELEGLEPDKYPDKSDVGKVYKAPYLQTDSKVLHNWTARDLGGGYTWNIISSPKKTVVPKSQTATPKPSTNDKINAGIANVMKRRDAMNASYDEMISDNWNNGNKMRAVGLFFSKMDKNVEGNIGALNISNMADKISEFTGYLPGIGQGISAGTGIASDLMKSGVEFSVGDENATENVKIRAGFFIVNKITNKMINKRIPIEKSKWGNSIMKGGVNSVSGKAKEKVINTSH